MEAGTSSPQGFDDEELLRRLREEEDAQAGYPSGSAPETGGAAPASATPEEDGVYTSDPWHGQDYLDKKHESHLDHLDGDFDVTWTVPPLLQAEQSQGEVTPK